LSVLVAAAPVWGCDTAVVVAPAGRILAFGERLDRRSLMKGRAIDDHQLALARRYRIVGLQRHRNAPLQSRGHVDSMTFFKGHDRAFHIGLLTDLVTENFPLSRPRERVDAFYLNVEQLLDCFLDLRLGGSLGHLEHDLVVLGRHCCLLGDDRRNDDVVVAGIAGAHLNRASSASSAALVSTKVLRRRMSYTLMPCTGRTSILGMLRAAVRKFDSISAPSIISAFSRPSLPNCFISPLALLSFTDAFSSTMMPPSFALDERACLSASARTFFGSSMAWLRTIGPNARPPPRN